MVVMSWCKSNETSGDVRSPLFTWESNVRLSSSGNMLSSGDAWIWPLLRQTFVFAIVKCCFWHLTAAKTWSTGWNAHWRRGFGSAESVNASAGFGLSMQECGGKMAPEFLTFDAIWRVNPLRKLHVKHVMRWARRRHEFISFISFFQPLVSLQII